MILAPDVTIVELGQFAKLLRDGDARAVESLFMPCDSGVFYSSPEWSQLCLPSVRCRFLTLSTVDKYLSDACGQKG
jgi:hypothetical protein